MTLPVLGISPDRECLFVCPAAFQESLSAPSGRRSQANSTRFRAQSGSRGASRCSGRRCRPAGCRARCSTPATAISALIEPAAHKGIEFRHVPAPSCPSQHRRLSPCWLSSGWGVGPAADCRLTSGHRPVRLLVVRTTHGVAQRACRVTSRGTTVSGVVWPPACPDIAGITATHDSKGTIAAARRLHGCVHCSRRCEPLSIGGSRPSACAAGRFPEQRRWAGRATGDRRAPAVTVTPAGCGMTNIVLSAVPTVHRRVPATGGAETLGDRWPRSVTVLAGCVDASARTCRTSGYRPAPPVTVTVVEPCTANTCLSAAVTVHRSAPATGNSQTLLHRRPQPVDIAELSIDPATAGDTNPAPGYRRISAVTVTASSHTPPSASVTVHKSRAHMGNAQTLIYRHCRPLTAIALGIGRRYCGTQQPNLCLSAVTPGHHHLHGSPDASSSPVADARASTRTSSYRRIRPVTVSTVAPTAQGNLCLSACPPADAQGPEWVQGDLSVIGGEVRSLAGSRQPPPDKHLAVGSPCSSPPLPSSATGEPHRSNSHLSAFPAGHAHA